MRTQVAIQEKPLTGMIFGHTFSESRRAFERAYVNSQVVAAGAAIVMTCMPEFVGDVLLASKNYIVLSAVGGVVAYQRNSEIARLFSVLTLGIGLISAVGAVSLSTMLSIKINHDNFNLKVLEVFPPSVTALTVSLCFGDQYGIVGFVIGQALYNEGKEGIDNGVRMIVGVILSGALGYWAGNHETIRRITAIAAGSLVFCGSLLKVAVKEIYNAYRC